MTTLESSIHHIEPPEAERVYYRRNSDGQLGYRVKNSQGDDLIRLDRPNELLLEVLSPRWILERSTHPLNPFQIAQIQFSADVLLAKHLGIFIKKKTWQDLSDEDRILFASKPPSHPLRFRLYNAISISLSPPPPPV
jgi:hypothetical protein